MACYSIFFVCEALVAERLAFFLPGGSINRKALEIIATKHPITENGKRRKNSPQVKGSSLKMINPSSAIIL